MAKWEGAARLAASLALAFATAPAWAQAPAAAATPPPLDLPIEGVLEPHFTSIPDGDQMSSFYPKLALYLDLKARVSVGCQTTAQGGLAHCAVDDVQPAGLGFSEAALRMTPFFTLKPRTRSGTPVGGDDVTFSFTFVMPPKPDAPVTPTPAPPDPQALALARALVIATGLQAKVDREMKVLHQYVQSQVAADAAEGMTDDPAQVDQVLASMDQAGPSAIASYSDQTAKLLAQQFSLADLKAILAFVRSPAGRDWVAGEAALARPNVQAWIDANALLTAAARDRLSAASGG